MSEAICCFVICSQAILIQMFLDLHCNKKSSKEDKDEENNVKL